MASVRVNQKTGPLQGHGRRQTTWMKSEDKLKQWRKAATNQTSKHTKGHHAASSTERKSDVTRSGRLSDGTIHSSSTSTTRSSSEPGLNFRRLQDVDDIEQKESIEKCLKWMETLPDKFSGMHIFVQPSTTDDHVS